MEHKHNHQINNCEDCRRAFEIRDKTPCNCDYCQLPKHIQDILNKGRKNAILWAYGIGTQEERGKISYELYELYRPLNAHIETILPIAIKVRNGTLGCKVAEALEADGFDKFDPWRK